MRPAPPEPRVRTRTAAGEGAPRRVIVLHNADEHLVAGGEREGAAVVAVQACARAVAEALASLGHEPLVLAAAEEPARLLHDLAQARADVLFNLVESYRGESALEPAACALLELSGVPFTGNGALTHALALRKPLAKALLEAHGVAVPAGLVLERGDEPLHALLARAPFPWIVKPSREDASHGIDETSVVHDEAAARARARDVIARWRQPALVERFVEGREINVALIGPAHAPELLPPAEIDFRRLPAGRPRLVTYAAKWIEGSPDWNGADVVDAALAPAVETAVRAAALAAWRALGLRGYARVDLRLDAGSRPFVLEANPNPDLSPDAGFARAWGRTGRTYGQLVDRILSLAWTGPPA